MKYNNLFLDAAFFDIMWANKTSIAELLILTLISILLFSICGYSKVRAIIKEHPYTVSGCIVNMLKKPENKQEKDI